LPLFLKAVHDPIGLDHARWNTGYPCGTPKNKYAYILDNVLNNYAFLTGGGKEQRFIKQRIRVLFGI
jgi:hypothetical protein